MKYLGIHIIADLYNVVPNMLEKIEDVKAILEESVKYSNLSKISSHYKQFYPAGVTGIILLEESHISIHTWPEYEYASIDIYTCGDKSKALRAFDFIVKVLKPQRIEKQVIHRGEING